LFVPVHDINPLKRLPFQWVTVSLIAINILGYLVFGTLFFSPADEYAIDFALIPQELVSDEPSLISMFRTREPLPFPEWVTVFTYMFVHVNFLHLAGNMTFLWVFGDNVEDAMGRWRFLFFYLSCGAAAGVVHTVLLQGSEMPVIGASGAVSGIIAAYLMLHPNVRIWVLALYRIPLRITAAIVVIVWLGLQVYYAVTDTAEVVAWEAHLAGFAVGLVLVCFLRQPGVPLFDRTISKV